MIKIDRGRGRSDILGSHREMEGFPGLRDGVGSLGLLSTPLGGGKTKPKIKECKTI